VSCSPIAVGRGGRAGKSRLVLVLLVLCLIGCQSDGTPPEEALGQLEARRQKARKLYERALELSNADRKRQLYEQAVELDDRLGPAHANLGVLLFREGDHYEAAQHLQRAADLMSEDPTPYANLAVLHAEVSQWNRALEYAKKAKERDGQHILTLRTMARALIETRDSKKRIKEALRDVIQRDPSERWRRWAIRQSKAIEDQSPLWEQ